MKPNVLIEASAGTGKTQAWLAEQKKRVEVMG